MTEHTPVRVRIAPSPTGHLHLGTVRTALYNYLFAKKEGGTFILRTEDTDLGRSLAVYEEEILTGLRNLGIIWDEGPDIGGPYAPYRQTERTDIYKKYIQKLLDEKKAYYCFCSKEDLEKQREAMLASGIAPRYSGSCASLSEQEVSNRFAKGEQAVIRLRVPLGIELSFHDLIRGKISVMSDTIGDMVIARTLTSPLYNLAVVIDDQEMHITHVIRGEDHITNTSKQLLIQQALGCNSVVYAHLPLILTPDRKKLSKRSLETSFVEYVRDGYIPEAMVNFLALLGWSPEDEKELMTLQEMVKKFSIKRVQKSGAAFNMDKLDWFNGQYIRSFSLDELLQRLVPFIPSSWLDQKDVLRGALQLERERIKLLSEFKDGASFFFELPLYDTPLLAWKDTSLETTHIYMREVRTILDNIDTSSWNKSLLESTILPITETRGRGEVLWPLRVALSGQKNSPGPFEIMDVLGKQESLQRIDIAITKIVGYIATPVRTEINDQDAGLVL